MFNIGDLISDPFGREEFVTVTGFDSVKNTVHYKTKDGTPGARAFRDPLEAEGVLVKKQTSSPKITKKASTPKSDLTNAPISYIGTDLPPLPKMEQQQQAAPKVVEEKPTEPVADAIKEDTSKWSNYHKALAGVEFFVDIMNARTAYSSTTGQARLNILQARNEAADAIYRGRLAQMDRQSEGLAAGNNAKLAMAAQGQDVSGAGVEKISGSFEAIGYENGAREMINAYREALGYELEEINYEYQIDQAGIARDNAILGSALNFGTKMAVL